jgi:hypothetical protein
MLVLYAAQLRDISLENIDHLYGTCNLHVMIAFFNNSVDQPEIEDPEDHECDWNAFKTLQGGRILQLVPRFRDQLSQGVWMPVLEEAGQYDEVTMTAEHACKVTYLENKIEDLQAYCGLLSDPHATASPCSEPLRQMRVIVGKNLNYASISQLFLVIAQLTPAFLNLLEELDPKAFLVLAYIFALILQVPQWWTIRTATYACRRVCAFLYRSYGGQLRKWLDFPATQSGLNLELTDLKRGPRGWA